MIGAMKVKPMMDDERRIGKVKVSHTLLRQWKSLWPVMKKLVVLRAESRFDQDLIEYIAFSELFDVVPEGIEPPYYDFTITKVKGKPLRVEAKKV